MDALFGTSPLVWRKWFSRCIVQVLCQDLQAFIYWVAWMHYRDRITEQLCKHACSRYARACALGYRTGPPGYIGWRASTNTLCRSQLYPPVRDYELGSRTDRQKLLIVIECGRQEYIKWTQSIPTIKVDSVEKHNIWQPTVTNDQQSTCSTYLLHRYPRRYFMFVPRKCQSRHQKTNNDL